MVPDQILQRCERRAGDLANRCARGLTKGDRVADRGRRAPRHLGRVGDHGSQGDGGFGGDAPSLSSGGKVGEQGAAGGDRRAGDERATADRRRGTLLSYRPCKSSNYFGRRTDAGGPMKAAAALVERGSEHGRSKRLVALRVVRNVVRRAPVRPIACLPGRSGRGIAVTYAARSYASWLLSVPGRSNGMLWRMNDAARSTRAIDAPILNDRAPHRAGTGPMPAPSVPWQRAQFSVKSAFPRAESPESAGIFGKPSPRTCSPSGTPRGDEREIRDDVVHLAAVGGEL